MNNNLNEFKHEMGIVADFLGNHWQAFLEFCEEFDIDESRAEEICTELELFSGRS